MHKDVVAVQQLVNPHGKTTRPVHWLNRGKTGQVRPHHFFINTDTREYMGRHCISKEINSRTLFCFSDFFQEGIGLRHLFSIPTNRDVYASPFLPG